MDVFGTNDVIPLWVADMDFRTPDFIIDALRKRLDHEILGYHIHPESFYTAVQQWVWRRAQWKMNTADMAFSPGIVPALNFTVNALTAPGDKIMINKPVYHPFMFAVQDHNRQLINSPLKETNGKYTIDFDDFEKKLSDGVKMYLLCSPHNPVGRVWKYDELERIGALCVKYNVILVADEIHSDLIIKPHKHTHIASISPEIAQQTLTFLAPSKTFNLAGMFTAVVHSENKRIMDAFKQYVAKMHLGYGNIFGDVALEAAYNHGDAWLSQLLDYLDGNFDFVINFLKKHIPAIKTEKPEGTYLMWLDCQNLNLSPKKLDHFMIEKAGLALTSGHIFGEEGAGFMRLNVAAPRAIIAAALRQLSLTTNH
jgi:cystathionine beta-lyase